MPTVAIRRLATVARCFGRYGLVELIPDQPETAKARRAARLFAGKPDPVWQAEPLPKRLRLALTELGPLFVKFGQALSTRPDILPADYIDELALLQDKVPPFDLAEVHSLLEAAYGKPASDVFDWFDNEPLASASIAQVHAARLLPDEHYEKGREVVVKILRPDVSAIVERDLAMLKLLAEQAERFIPDARLIKPVAIVRDYELTCRTELDLLAEAANAELLRNNSLKAGTLYVPEVEWDYCHNNVFVMERIWGLPVSEVDKMRAAGVNLELLAQRGVETFFSQVFTDNFFHADMHPGNVLADISTPEDPTWIALDFGIMGRLTSADQLLVAQLLVAFSNGNFGLIAKLLAQGGWVGNDKPIAGLEASLRVACGPMVDAPLSEISFGEVLGTLLQAAKRYEIQPAPTLVLLEKTIVNVEGLGRRLYPELDLWATAKPFLEQWVRRKLGPEAVVERLQEDWPILLGQLPQLRSTLTAIADSPARQQDMLEQQRLGSRRVQWTVVGTGAAAAGLLVAVLAKPVLGSFVLAAGLLVVAGQFRR